MSKISELLPAEACFPGRGGDMVVGGKHAVKGNYYIEPFPSSTKSVVLGLGCFWGAERFFWNLPGVYTTAVGYAGGVTKHPSYEEVCTGYTNHSEVVLVVYEPELISLDELFSHFWEAHDPTQGMCQGADQGTQYRSAIYVNSQEDLDTAEATKNLYQSRLKEAGKGQITTEIEMLEKFFYAEDYHQQYLHKNPNGYCGLAGCGVNFEQ